MKMSFQLKIDPKDRKAARFISKLQKTIQKALSDSGKSQQEVASILGVDRSVVNRRLKGGANLTARSVAEFAYALDKDIVVQFVDKHPARGINWTTVSENVMDVQGQQSLTTGTIEPTKKFSLQRISS